MAHSSDSDFEDRAAPKKPVMEISDEEPRPIQLM